MTTRICFIRHGETDWNVEKRIQGQTDVPLNETGHKQALAMAFSAAHHEFHAIYSSDLVRARDTAGMLAERRGLEVQPLPLLRERNFGIFEGLTAAGGEQRHPEAYLRYKARDPEYDFATGESLNAFAARVASAVEHIVHHHPDQLVAAVTHGGVLVYYFVIPGTFSESLAGQMQGVCAPEWPPHFKHAQHSRWPASGSPAGSPPQAPCPRCGA
jgi:2,3-bisphosphoglycerate-dependent phosphoglycerate mutase